MKTPVSVLMMAIAYWILIYGVTLVPQYVSNYYVNLVWMTIVIPNVLRFAIGNIPRLAVDRVFFLTSTLIALVLTFLINQISSETKDAVTNPDASNNKKLKLSALLAGTFAAGALATYFAGIDTSIYSNMGWETTV
jgi:hypothetical protein